MVDGGASGSEGSDISGIDEYIPDHFDGETDGFRHKFTLVLPNWVTDLGRFLMKMVHNCSSNRQIGMILVAKCSYCICLQLVSAMLPCIHTRNSPIDVLKFGVMFSRIFFSLF